MNNQATQLMDHSDVREGDILFECPFCSKSMAIEQAGAGLMVPCARCGKSVQVPIPEGLAHKMPTTSIRRRRAPAEESSGEIIRQLDASLSLANDQIDQLIAEKESLQERRAYLEQLRATNGDRLERIARELDTIQDALDRALVMLSEAKAEKPA